MTAAAKPRSRLPRWPLAVLAVLALAVAAYLVWRSRTSETAAAAPAQETATVSAQDFRLSVTGPGTLAAANTFDVKADVSGTLSQLPAVGDRVTQGQLIVRIDPAPFQRAVENNRLALQKAQASLAGLRSSQASSQSSQGQQIETAELSLAAARRGLASAQTSLASVQALFAAGGASAEEVRAARDAVATAQESVATAGVNLEGARESRVLSGGSNAQDLKNAELAVEQARLTLQGSEEDLASTKVYAPFAGVVSAVTGQVGGPTGSEALVTLIDDSKMELPVQVDESEISQVKVGQKAEVTVEAASQRPFAGTVTTITPSAEVVSNIPVFYVTVTLDNPERLLRSGMSAEAEIISREVENALLVPRRAVQTVRRRSYVSVKAADGTVEERRVTLLEGATDGTNVVVSEGLQAGETVVLPTRQTITTQQSGGGGVRIPLGGGGR